MTERLGRDGRGASPVRLVHLGLGNFFRAHQAAYTAAVPGWGIAAFTGRGPKQAEMMTAQDGLYTLLTRAAGSDDLRVIDSVSVAYPAADHTSWLRHLADPAVVALTTTVTEAAYLLDGPALKHRDLEQDLDRLRSDREAVVSTVPGRLVAGLLARWHAARSPIAVVPCDNLPSNGDAVRELVCASAESLVDKGFARWVRDDVSFVSTMVDRITPSTTAADREIVLDRTGVVDECVVVTEPFSEWVLSGDFPAGRPPWEEAGARLTTDIAIFERRKLWMLNGAHSLLAYVASIRGHGTVSSGIEDEVCRQWVEEWWDEAERHLELASSELLGYRAALLDRFANPAIAHRLSQIAMDGTQKLPIRIVPVVVRERTAGRVPEAGAMALAAWILHLRGHGAPVHDVDGPRAQRAASGGLDAAVPTVLNQLHTGLGEDRQLIEAVRLAVDRLDAQPVMQRSGSR